MGADVKLQGGYQSEQKVIYESKVQRKTLLVMCVGSEAMHRERASPLCTHCMMNGLITAVYVIRTAFFVNFI